MSRARYVVWLVSIAMLPLTGCVSVWRGTARSFDVAPNGLLRTDDALRRALVAGSFADAQSQVVTPKTGAPDDQLLRALYQGTASYYAEDYAQSVQAFAMADKLTEERYTKSVSKAGLSLLTNDLALPFVPSRTEQLFVRYYAMMAFLRTGDMTAATVEARRLGHLLEAQSADVRTAERMVHAVMREAAGAVFEASGEINDALVSYRNAAVLRGASLADVDTMRLTTPTGDSATLVVVVESGFVAYRVDRGITIPIGDGRNDSDETTGQWLARLPNGGVYADDLTLVSNDDDVAIEPMEGELANLDRADRDELHADKRRRGHGSRNRATPTKWLRVAWPALRRTPMPTSQLTLTVDAVQYAVTSCSGDVSEAVAEDMRRARPALVARMIARATAKTAAVEALDGDKEWVGSILSALGTGLERADVRSWQLLPGSIRTVRVTVPSGTLTPVLYVGAPLERVAIRLPAVHTSAGSIAVVSARVWRDAAAMVANVP